MGHRYGKRPSEIIGIKNEIEAFDFDSSIILKAVKMQEDKANNKDFATGKQTKGMESLKAMKKQVDMMRGK